MAKKKCTKCNSGKLSLDRRKPQELSNTRKMRGGALVAQFSVYLKCEHGHPNVTYEERKVEAH